jgi:2-polyprenyl-3-methyl-5-hydroxy-6-metoxy-1,4-benzoquinol methylase
MLVWEDKEQFQDTTEIAAELERIGRPVIDRYNKPKVLHDQENGRYWFKHSKVWEYPFAVWWLKQLAERLGKQSLKVMDFGCWLCPFPEYLAQQGHEVWGVDDDSWGYFKQCDVGEYYPHVNYHVADVRTLGESDFDAIISCSVLEHIEPVLRIDLLKHLGGMLQPDGKQMHLVDFYFPEMPGRDSQRMNFHQVAAKMGWGVPDLSLCPGADEFHFPLVRNRIRFVRKDLEARIATGDDW